MTRIIYGAVQEIHLLDGRDSFGVAGYSHSKELGSLSVAFSISDIGSEEDAERIVELSNKLRLNEGEVVRLVGKE